MPYTRKIVLKLKGDELNEFLRAWRQRGGIHLLLSRLAEVCAQHEAEYNEVWRAFAERHGLDQDDISLLFDPKTGDIYKREWVDKPKPDQGQAE